MRRCPGSSLWLCLLVLCGSASLPLPLWAQEAGQEDAGYAGHFRVFTGKGEPATLQDVFAAMEEADAVLVGEIHTDPVGHWIEAELLREALDLTHADAGTGARRTLALSLEMFERDVQDIVDEYLQDLITESQFKASARPWEHYETDYRPLVEMAKAAGIRVLAANAPRRYVNRVSRLGPDALNALPWRAKSFLPPLPYPPPTEAYRDEWTSLMSEMTMETQCPEPEEGAEGDEEAGDMENPHAQEMPDPIPSVSDSAQGPPAGMPPHAGSFMENGLMAQTLWDASMAHSITAFLDSHPGALVIHMVGGFHVKNFTGIPEKVRFYRPETHPLVVHMDLADDYRSFDPAEHAGRGDFVILTDRSLDLYYERNCTDQ